MAVSYTHLDVYKRQALLISGASLCRSPAREAVLLAMEYAQASGVRIIFDPDYRKDGWNSLEETSLYYHQAAKYADIIISTREEFDILESLTHPGNDDDRLSAEAYLNHRASLVCIKHGEKMCIRDSLKIPRRRGSYGKS